MCKNDIKKFENNKNKKNKNQKKKSKKMSQIIGAMRGYNEKQNQVRFAYSLCKVLSEYTATKKIPHGTSIYKILTTLRKKLKIPGKSYEKIDMELREKYPLIPDFLFEEKTKDERVKIYDDYVEMAKLPK